MYEVTGLSHYMAARFPGSKDSKPWQPLVIGQHATLNEAERHVNRIRLAHSGVLPVNRTFAIRRTR